MKIRGKEIQFLRTVKATSDIAKLCPDEDIERVGELFDGNVPKIIEVGAKLVHYLNEGYEMSKHYDDPSYVPNVISVDEIMYLDEQTFIELMKDAFNSISNGAQTTIEVESTDKKKETPTTE